MKKIIACIAVLTYAGTANAEGFYVGGAIGFGEAEFQADEISSGPLAGTPLDDSERVGAIKAIGGYRANRWISLEASLVGAGWDGDDLESDVSFGALSASVLGILPVGERVELFARLGGFFGSSEVEAPGDIFSSSENDEGVVWGVGAFVNLGSRKQFTIRAEFEQYDLDDVSGDVIADPFIDNKVEDLWLFTGGFQYNF
ncbi:MAG: outer membrane beta-barrel protein [Gammaproteobacteria bacterium]